MRKKAGKSACSSIQNLKPKADSEDPTRRNVNSGLKKGVYTSLIGVGRSNARNHPYSVYAVSASPREPPPGSLSRLIPSSPCLSLFGLYVPGGSQHERSPLSLNPQLISCSTEHRVFAPTLDIMDIIVSYYMDDIVILDYTDCVHTFSDLQTFLLYYMMYHNISLPLIHAAHG
ncbi:uncharacterized protein ARMOST_08342 [Armillaria ostoyae]|uniref:Uncharacterized protein n=1 Tax=Armillaria ostoyae TaxID=47428 RepID=A0A284R8C3_ARMOS|nr:uncharacterized protein ARMOST_08342 [Armillaria ostoyae]